MKTSALILGSIILLTIAIDSTAQDSIWTKRTAGEWFAKKEWLNGAKGLSPISAIDKTAFAKQYHSARKWWDEAFGFLSRTDLAEISPGRYSIDGEDVYATVYEGRTKLIDTTKWESHKNFADIHFVFSGKEQIGVAPVVSAKPITAYNEERDITLYTANGQYYPISPGTFMIVFPHQAHRPALQVDGYDSVKHIVVKVRRAP